METQREMFNAFAIIPLVAKFRIETTITTTITKATSHFGPEERIVPSGTDQCSCSWETIALARVPPPCMEIGES